MTFAAPYALLLLLAIPLLIIIQSRRRRAGLRFSCSQTAKASGQSHRQRFILMPTILRILALILLIIAIARPQAGIEKVYDISKGVAIEMVVDRSSSMGADMQFGSEKMNRLQVVKKVFSEFVLGNNKNLQGRPSDLVGLISFARYPDTNCPLTLAHGALDELLANIELVDNKMEDGTAIGDALMLAASRLKTAEEALQGQKPAKSGRRQYEIKSKIIILLTDGINNRGEYTPQQAAALAKKWGIKIYTIGVGSNTPTTRKMLGFFNLTLPQGPSIDKKMLQSLAQTSGGIFRLAEDADGLRAIYKEIDKLEKSEVESVRYIDYKELFARFALAAFILLGLEFILTCTVFRKLP